MVVLERFAVPMHWRMQRLDGQRSKRCSVGKAVRMVGVVGECEHVVVVVLNAGIESEIVENETVVIIAGTVVVESLPMVLERFLRQKYVVMKRDRCECYDLHCVRYLTRIHDAEAEGMQ
jgi:hypothetical protein